MSKKYIPIDVFNYARDDDVGNLVKALNALNYNKNSTNWHIDVLNGYRPIHAAAIKGRVRSLGILLDKGADMNCKDYHGYTPYHRAAISGFVDCVQFFLNKGVDINSKSLRESRPSSGNLIASSLHFSKENDHKTALILAAAEGHTEVVKLLCEEGSEISDIKKYAPSRGPFEENPKTDCRPIILAEIENRRKRAAFDSFIERHIKYQPYIDRISQICYPSGEKKIAAPTVGWARADEVRDKFYFDEIFFYLHLFVSKVFTQAATNTLDGDSSIVASSCRDHFSINSDKTSALMAVLTSYLKEFLQPSIILCSRCNLEGLLRCSRCKEVYYCSSQCQRNDWRHHKLVCNSLPADLSSLSLN